MNRSIAQNVASCAVSVTLHIGLILAIYEHAIVTKAPANEKSRPAPLIAYVALQSRQVSLDLAGVRDVSTFALAAGRGIAAPQVPLPEIDSIAVDAVHPGREIESLDDYDAVKQLQGLYLRQINSRLERVMEMQPQTVSLPGNARCIVHVVQNEQGAVLDVDTVDCDLEIDDRQRVVNLIRAASPLPLPPDGLAMGTYLKLDLSTL